MKNTIYRIWYYKSLVLVNPQCNLLKKIRS
jgi:hypothetical protein